MLFQRTIDSMNKQINDEKGDNSSMMNVKKAKNENWHEEFPMIDEKFWFYNVYLYY